MAAWWNLVDTPDLNSCGPYGPCGFDSRCRYYQIIKGTNWFPFLFIELFELSPT